ncbi:hypothetical protein [Oscillibacter sp. ER4]|uniref:hypothetical protein n=1 Tax=Oscillibacter sp. ER4 TaxID=1519439 RepID=UPI00051B496C|nr:hypothetical protein [Oscillibacter sp. ER4]
METTPNYKLPQWVKADQIKMDDFNGAFGKIDAALKANADAINRAADAESVNAQIAAVQEQIVAVEQEIKLVSLGDVRTTTAANGSIVYDLSALNMADYRAFLVFASVNAAGSSVSDAGKIELLCNDKNLGELGNATGGRASTVAWIFPAYRGVGAGYHTPTQNRNSSYEGVSGALLNEDAVWNSMQSLTLKFTGRAGASAVLYGLKK